MRQILIDLTRCNKWWKEVNQIKPNWQALNFIANGTLPYATTCENSEIFVQ